MKSRLLVLLAALTGLNANLAPAQTDNIPVVTAKTVQDLSFYPVKSAPAKVLPLNQAKIPARVSGVIETLPVKVGDTVSKGDVVARLDCQDNQLALTQLKSELKQASLELQYQERNLKRATTLAEKNSLTEAELDRKKTDSQSAKAQAQALNAKLKQQKLNVERCNITAPFDGLVIQRLQSEGEQVNVGQAVIELLQTSQAEVSAQIPLADLTSFEQAAQYSFYVNNQSYPLTVRKLLPVVNDNSRAIESRLEFNAKTVFTGVTGTVKWHSPAPHLPAYLLQKRGNQYGFFVVKNNKAKFITVDNAREGRPIQLPDNQHYQVIIDGRYSLTDNKAVTLLKDDKTLISEAQR